MNNPHNMYSNQKDLIKALDREGLPLLVFAISISFSHASSRRSPSLPELSASLAWNRSLMVRLCLNPRLNNGILHLKDIIKMSACFTYHTEMFYVQNYLHKYKKTIKKCTLLKSQYNRMLSKTILKNSCKSEKENWAWWYVFKQDYLLTEWCDYAHIYTTITWRIKMFRLSLSNMSKFYKDLD